MGRLINDNDVLNGLYDDEEIICTRDYNICVLDTMQKLEQYEKESENILKTYIKTSDIIKNLCEAMQEDVFNFLLECDALAQKMSATILIVYQKNSNRISANIFCEEITLRENEIQSLIKICALTPRIKIFSNGTDENSSAAIEFIFELSGKAITLTNIIHALKEKI